MIGLALNGDGAALQQLENASGDTTVLEAALSLLHQPEQAAQEPGLRGSRPAAKLQFASVMVLRHARTAPNAAEEELTQLVQQCLELGLRPAEAKASKPTQENLLAAAAAAACRLSPDAISAVHAEGGKLYQQQLAAGGGGGAEDGILALKLLRLLADEAARPAVAAAAQPTLAALAPETLGVVGWAVSVGGAVIVAGLRCLQQWVAAAQVRLEDAGTIPGLLESLCAALGGEDAVVAEALVEAFASFIPGMDWQGPSETGLPALLALCNACSEQRGRLDYPAERVQYGVGRATARLAAALAAAPLPWVDAPLASAAAGLLALLADAASCPDRPTSALAIEGIGGLQRARNRFKSGQAGGEAEGVLSAQAELALVPALLAHARYPSPDDSDLDDDEWARVREDVVSQACLSSYCVLRHDFLGTAAEQLQQGLQGADWRQLESALFAMASTGGPVEVRLIEMGAAEPEQSSSTELLQQVFALCLQVEPAAIAAAVGAATDPDDAEEESATAGAALWAAVARLVGHHAGWLAAEAPDVVLLGLLDAQLDQLLSQVRSPPPPTPHTIRRSARLRISGYWCRPTCRAVVRAIRRHWSRHWSTRRRSGWDKSGSRWRSSAAEPAKGSALCCRPTTVGWLRSARQGAAGPAGMSLPEWPSRSASCCCRSSLPIAAWPRPKSTCSAHWWPGWRRWSPTAAADRRPRSSLAWCSAGWAQDCRWGHRLPIRRHEPMRHHTH